MRHTRKRQRARKKGRKEIRRWDPWEGEKKDARPSNTRMRGRWIPGWVEAEKTELEQDEDQNTSLLRQTPNSRGGKHHSLASICLSVLSSLSHPRTTWREWGKQRSEQWTESCRREWGMNWSRSATNCFMRLKMMFLPEARQTRETDIQSTKKNRSAFASSSHLLWLISFLSHSLVLVLRCSTKCYISFLGWSCFSSLYNILPEMLHPPVLLSPVSSLLSFSIFLSHTLSLFIYCKCLKSDFLKKWGNEMRDIIYMWPPFFLSS